MEQGKKKGRREKHSQEELLKMLDGYLAECGGISRFKYSGLASFMERHGMLADSNYLRHNKTIQARIAQLHRDDEGAGLEEAGAGYGCIEGCIEDPREEELRKLREENQKLREFIATFFVPGVCNYLIGSSDTGIKPRQILKPEKAGELIIRADSEPFEKAHGILIEAYRKMR